MFTAAAGAPVPYEDPWQVSFDDRLSMLLARRTRIAYFYELPEAHAFRYRVFNMLEALEAQPELGVSASWFTYEDHDRGLRFVDSADALVICRSRYCDLVGRMISRARARGIPVLFDIDDLVFDIRYAHDIGAVINRSLNTSEEWDWWFGYISRYGATLQLCDTAITTNEYLAKRISDFMPSIKTKVVPNFYNKRQALVSDQILRRKQASGFKRDGRIHIGYFSGTNTHNHDFGLIANALARILERNPLVTLRIVGLLDIPPQILPFQDRIEVHPLQDFVNLQRLQGEIEVCLAPLQNSIFSNCKSDLKYFEAALVGTAVIASPTVAFSQAIVDGENGFLARAHQWEQKIGNIVEWIETDFSSYRALIERSLVDVRKRYEWSRQGIKIVSAILGTTGIPTVTVPDIDSEADRGAGVT